jgi:Golgi SNAP receptor complex protein 2
MCAAIHRRIVNMREAYRSLKHTYDREMSQWDRRIRDANNRNELFRGADASAETKSVANDLNNERDMLLQSLASGNQTAEWLGTLSSHIGAQGDRLKGVQRSLISMASTLGLSDSVIKMIGRREFMDRLLLFALMLLTLIVFVLCYWYM